MLGPLRGVGCSMKERVGPANVFRRVALLFKTPFYLTWPRQKPCRLRHDLRVGGTLASKPEKGGRHLTSLPGKALITLYAVLLLTRTGGTVVAQAPSTKAPSPEKAITASPRPLEE